MPLSKKLCNIRYFNYLNVPLLYSIYSQVFEGITDRITEEKIILLCDKRYRQSIDK